jgi:VCBS repeat-containing protein
VADSQVDYLAKGQEVTETFTVTVNDGQGGTVAQVVTVVITGTNDAPVVNAISASASEDGPAVMLTASFTDVDTTDKHTFTIDTTGTKGSVTNNKDGTFSYNPNGKFESLAAGQQTTDSFTYTVNDGNGGVVTKTATVTVTGVNDAPTALQVSSTTVLENTSTATDGLKVADLDTLDVDAGDSFTYSIVGGLDNGSFKLVGDALWFVKDVVLNAEAKSSYEVTLRSTDAGKLFVDRALTIQVSDVDEFDVSAPTFLVQVMVGQTAPNTVPENAATGTSIGIRAQASDADLTLNTISYELVGDDKGAKYSAGEFAIDDETGVITVAGTVNREAGATRTLFVRATSADDSSAISSLTLNIVDENEFKVSVPDDTDAAANEVSENASRDTRVGITAKATDADATTNTVSYTLVGAEDGTGEPSGEFAIDAVNGVVTVAGPIDREAGATRTLYVKATSADGSSATSTFTVNVIDVNEFTPVFSSGAEGAVDENAATSVVVYQALATDADATAVITYSLGGDDFKSLAIDSNGAVTLKESANFEGKDRYRFNVLANDGVNTATQAVLLSVKNVLELPAQGLDVTGDLWVGGVLALDLSAVSVADRAFLTFQWTANGASIAGATASSFTLSDAQVGMTMGVVVTGVGISGSVAVQMPGAGLVSAVDPASTLPAGTGGTGGTPVGSTVVVQAPESEDSGGGDGSGDSSSSGLVTLVSGMSQESGDSTAGGLITSVTTSANTEGVPSSVSTPLGTLSFTATSSAPDGEGGELLSVPDTFSLYVDKDQGINGFWVVDPNTGRLVNLASSVQGGQIVDMGDGKLRIDIKVSDSSPYDMETDIGVVQVDGALGYVAPVLSSSQQVVPPTVFWF